jgi:alpha-1,2-mannosyltransferase
MTSTLKSGRKTLFHDFRLKEYCLQNGLIHSIKHQIKMPIINAKRLHDYPRLMLFTTWTILALNVIFRNGWLSLVKQIIGSDFITLYGSGIAYKTDLPNLYNFTSQAAIQQALIKPTLLPGVNPYISPPYVAAVYSFFTFIKLPWAFLLWTLLTVLFTMVAVRYLVRLLPDSLKSNLDYWQLLIIVLSFFPFIEGFQAGQNHGLTLLLVTCILTFTLSERWFLAGSMAGLMIFKPQMVLGFLLIWVIWRKYKALAAFAIVAILWTGSILITKGITPYLTYLSISRDFLLLPYIQGFPGYLLLTLYGLLTTIFPIESLSIIHSIHIIFSGILAIGIAILAYKSRDIPILARTPVIVLAILLPIVATPYALLHDLVIVIPGIILWARYENSRLLLNTAIVIYLCGFFLPLFASLIKIALMPFLTLGLVAAIFIWVFTQHKYTFWRDVK